ncbi:MAG: hypothetical protein U5L45_21875 [Saprospiraceae bacterium]|nr:hypothetical protein [Saprospiraceae bacterium]
MVRFSGFARKTNHILLPRASEASYGLSNSVIFKEKRNQSDVRRTLIVSRT